MSNKSISKQEALYIIKQFICERLNHEEWYQRCIDVIEVAILYGSVAHQTNRPDSDIDIALFMPLRFEQKYTKGEYFYEFADHEINIVIKSTEKLHKQITEGINQQDKHVFTDAEIIFAKDEGLGNELRRLGD